MIDPINITNSFLTDEKLEEYILFCIAVYGKPALTTAKLLENLLKAAHARKTMTPWMNPFKALRKYKTVDEMIAFLKSNRFGCYTVKGAGFHFIANSGLDLRICSAEQLYACPGISFKTAKFFILHTRKVECACLDTHILKWFRALGYEHVPSTSPQSHKVYHKWENIFLAESDKRNKKPWDLDLEIWNHYAGHKISKEVPV